MKKRTSVLFLVILVIQTGKLQAINLEDALKQKVVSLEAIGKGGYIGEKITLTLTSLSAQAQEITLKPGTIFFCKDTLAQSLMVVEEYLIALVPGERKSLNILTMCIEQQEYSPYANTGFSFFGTAKASLAELASWIAEKNYHNSTAQAAVWAISDNYPLSNIYGEDTAMVNSLAKIASKHTGMPYIPTKNPRKHYIQSLKTEMIYHFAKDSKVSLSSYDSRGVKIKDYYKNRTILTGLYLARLGVNRVSQPGEKITFKLTDEKGKVILEKTVDETSPEVRTDKYKLTTAFEYELKTPMNGLSMKLYDAQGKVLEEIFSNRSFPKSRRRMSYTFNHTAGLNGKFSIKVTDATGKIIAEHLFDSSKSVKLD